MHFSTTKSLLLALAAGQSVLAHTGFSNFYVDGVDQGDGTCVRMNLDPTKFSSPVEDLASEDMACGHYGTKGVSRVCPAKGGSTVTFEFRWYAEDPSKGFMDPSHKGPCSVYMKKVDSAVQDKGSGGGWFKIWEEGYDESAGKWCTEKIMSGANGSPGRLSVTIPPSIEGGYYLVRPDLLALHNADKGDPQFYTGCAQVFLTDAGTDLPDKTVSIPGYVSSQDKGASFNIYQNPMALPYPVPGPPVAQFGGGSKMKKRTVQRTQTEGLKPAGCIMEAGNWCGKEVPDYSDEKGCWAAGQTCYDQNEDCWNNVPPTGGAHCKIWEEKCKGIQDQCSAGNFQGPPNKGKDLTPPHSTIQPPAPGNTYPGMGGSPQAGSGSSASDAKPTSAPAASSAAAVSAAAASSGSGSGNYEDGGYGSGSGSEPPAAESPKKNAPAPSAYTPPSGEASAPASPVGQGASKPAPSASAKDEGAPPKPTDAPPAPPSYGGGNGSGEGEGKGKGKGGVVVVTVTEYVTETEIEWHTVYDKMKRQHVRHRRHGN